MLHGLTSKFQTFFQGPAKLPQGQPAEAKQPELPATIQERFTQSRTPEELEGSGFTSVREEFVTTRPNPAWVAQQKSGLQPGQEFHEPASQTMRVGAEVHTDTGYLLKELHDGSSWMSTVTVQGPGNASARSFSGSLDLSQMSGRHSLTVSTQGSDNPRMGRVMTFSEEGVTVREIDSLKGSPSILHISPERSIVLEKAQGQGENNPRSMGQLQSDGSIAFDGSLAHLGVPKTLAIEFPLPLDLTSKMKPGS
jgi:hypothetical protein